MRRLAPILAAVALAAAGCGGGSESAPAPPTTTAPPPPTTTVAPSTPKPNPKPTTRPKPSRMYKKGELAHLALQPADAPLGMRYAKAESGPKTLEEVGIILDRQVKAIRKLGFRAAYDAIFDSTISDLRLGTRLWLFAAPKGASEWLASSKAYSTALQLQPIAAPILGDESFAVHGFATAGGAEILSHAFRVGNLVVLVSLTAQRARISEADGLTAARAALARTR